MLADLVEVGVRNVEVVLESDVAGGLKAAMRLRHTGHYAGSLGVSVRYRDDTRWHEDRHFNETQDTLHFTHVLNSLWAARPRAHLRLAPLQIGIVLGDLLESSAHTGDLFAAETENTRTRLHSAVDTLNKTFGKNSARSTRRWGGGSRPRKKT